MAEAVRLPVRECVGEALRFAVDNIRFVAIAAAAGAGALMLLTGLALLVSATGIVTSVAATFARAFVYAGLIAAALYGASAVRARLAGDGWRVWASMAIVTFFLFIVFFVLMIPGMIVLFSGPLAPYVGDLQAAGQDQGRVVEIMTRFAQEQPLAVLSFALFYAVVWLLLTSRLYLAAPASVDQNRVLTFETWKWTKGAMLQITWARLMLLGPAYVLVSALDYIVGRLAGIDAFDPAAGAGVASSNPALFVVYVFATTLITLLVYSSLEAGLSSALYRQLKQAAPR